MDQHTSVYGLIGYPLGHSLSPLIHNHAFKVTGVNGAYLPFWVQPNSISKVISSSKTMGIKGLNVTIPFKESIIPFLDRIDAAAERCGSVNTIVFNEGRAEGFNTDGAGFIKSLLQEGHRISGRAVILGAGGAARAIGCSLASQWCSVVFVNRTRERAKRLAVDLQRVVDAEILGMDDKEAEAGAIWRTANMIINTTPVGMYPRMQDMPPLNLDLVGAGAIICDIIYNPLDSRLLRESRAQGFKIVNGLGMFVNQGALAWEMFTGQKAPLQEMYDVVQRHLLGH